jgi:hypothetical protein
MNRFSRRMDAELPWPPHGDASVERWENPNKRLFNGIDPVIPEDEKFRCMPERIGDYTISFCA